MQTFVLCRNFSEAVLDIFNCQNVVLDNVSFQNNSGNGRLLEAVRGNSGSVAFGYNRLPSAVGRPTLSLLNCVFLMNRAMGFLPSESAVAEQVFLGRGGGMAVYINESDQAIQVEIGDCVFENNTARLFGGGLFILINSYETVQHIIRIWNSRFSGNIGASGGGGIQMSFLGSGNVDQSQTSFTISDCVFERNQGQSGGGMNIFIGMANLLVSVP
jgi:hypothetical protein